MVNTERAQILQIFGTVGTLAVATMLKAIAPNGLLTIPQVEAVMRLVAEDRAWLWVDGDDDLMYRVLNGGKPKP